MTIDPRNCEAAPDSEMIKFLNWESRALTGQCLNSAFIIDWIRKYNRASRQLYQDRALLAIGIHAGLIKKSSAIAPQLSEEERQRVLYFCREFLKSAGICASMREQKAPQ